MPWLFFLKNPVSQQNKQCSKLKTFGIPLSQLGDRDLYNAFSGFVYISIYIYSLQPLVASLCVAMYQCMSGATSQVM